MIRWEHKTARLGTRSQFPMSGDSVDVQALEDFFNVLGDEGWELVQVLSSGQWLGSGAEEVAIFRRERQPAEQPLASDG